LQEIEIDGGRDVLEGRNPQEEEEEEEDTYSYSILITIKIVNRFIKLKIKKK